MINGMKRRNDSQATHILRVRRRKRHRMVFRVLCCILVCVAAVIATTIFFRVSSIEVTGETRYSTEDIIGTSGVVEGDNLFFLHTKTIVQALTNTYPYLDTITIKRHLPGTLEIAVTERVPLICVEAEDGAEYYLDKEGQVLEKVSGSPMSGIILVTGTGAAALQVGSVIDSKEQDSEQSTGNTAKINSVLDVLNLFEKYELLDNVRSVDITKTSEVKLNYNDSYQIELGSLDALEHKIQFLKAVLKRDDLPATGIIDLSQGDKAHYRPIDYQAEEQESTESSAADTAGEQKTKKKSTSAAEADGAESQSTNDGTASDNTAEAQEASTAQ